MATDLPLSPPKFLVVTTNSHLVGRNHKLYGITRGVVFDGANVISTSGPSPTLPAASQGKNADFKSEKKR